MKATAKLMGFFWRIADAVDALIDRILPEERIPRPVKKILGWSICSDTTANRIGHWFTAVLFTFFAICFLATFCMGLFVASVVFVDVGVLILTFILSLASVIAAWQEWRWILQHRIGNNGKNAG